MSMATTMSSTGAAGAVADTGAAPDAVALPAGGQPRQEEGRGASTVLGMLLTITADAMILGSILAMYFAIRSGSSSWPPSGVKLGTYIPTVVTITAAMSMFSVAWALSAVRRHDQRNATVAVVLTIVLGLAMVNAQIFGLAEIGFGAGAHAYGTLYYLLVGYHIAHLIIGVIMLSVVGARALAGHFKADDYQPVRAAAISWHYGCAAWFVIVTALFLMSPHAKA